MREIDPIRSILAQVIEKSNSHPITDVNLILGELSDLTETTIRQHWSHLSKGTLAEQAKLHFRLIKAEVQCMTCFQKYIPLNRKIHSPNCGSFGAKILAGEEFRLESIELDNQ